jgi:arabinogalactan oligomer/maltooligosaccharide transport system substrate-binding protein
MPEHSLEEYMNKKRLGVIGLATTAALAVSGILVPVANAASAARTVTILSGAKSAEQDKNTPIIAAWAKTQGITVNVVYKDGPTARDEFIKSVPTGKGPDLLVGAHDWTGPLVGSGTVVPVVLGSTGNQFSKATKSGFTFEGKLYGVPIYTENIALIWNKRDSVDPTGKSLVDLITSKDGLAITRDLTNGDPYHYSSIASSFGLDFYTRNNSGWTKTLGYGKSGSDAYADFLVKYGKKIIRPADGWDAKACALQKGAYVISGPWMYNHGQDTISGCSAKALKKSEIGIANIPSAGGKTVHQFAGVYGFWQSSKVASQANSVAVGRVLRYIASAEYQSALYTAQGSIPANSAALAKVSDAGLKAFGVAGTNAYPMPSFVFQDAMWLKVGAAESAIIEGKYTGDAGDFLRKAIASAQSVIDSSK